MGVVSKDDFNLRSIVAESVTEIEEFEELHGCLLDACEGKLVSRLTDSKIRDLARELLSHLLPGNKNED